MIYLSIRDSPSQQKILALTDSSSALRWLYKASFPTQKDIHDKVTRSLAIYTIKNGASLYSQHIQGVHNFIAHSLSRDHHLPETVLTTAFHSLLSFQMPKNFTLYPLPNATTSYFASLSRLATKKGDLQGHRSRNKRSALIDGVDSWRVLESKTRGLRNLGRISALISCPPL